MKDKGWKSTDLTAAFRERGTGTRKEVRPDNFLVEANGELKELPFDYGFVCLGMRAEQPILKDLRDAFEEDGSIEIVNIGDSVRARRIIEGTEEGRNIINVLKKRDYL